jgi:hypothetical protein
LGLKITVTVSWFGPQNWQLWFGDLDLKITATVSLFGPQNQVGDDLKVVPKNRREDETARGTRRDLAACFAWKEVKVEFLSLASRLAELQQRVVHMAPS